MNTIRIPSRSRRDRQILERRRLAAGTLFKKGLSQAEVARRCKVSPEAARKWHAAWKNGGIRSLKSKGKPGPTATLTPWKIARIECALVKGPLAYGYHTELWTLERIRRVIKDTTGHTYGTTHTWRIMTRVLGWTAQKPETRAKERDEEGIRRWKRYVWPQVKRGREDWVPV